MVEELGVGKHSRSLVGMRMMGGDGRLDGLEIGNGKSFGGAASRITRQRGLGDPQRNAEGGPCRNWQAGRRHWLGRRPGTTGGPCTEAWGARS